VLHKALCQENETIASPRFKDVFPPTTSEAQERVTIPTMISPLVSTMESPAPPVQKVDTLSSPALGTEEPVTKEKATKPTTGLKYAEITKSDTDTLRALLVEDNEINLRLLVACMQKLKLSHLAATNGLEALETYKRNKGQFDVVFMGS
jgi:CheY-like chemotaxis protein